MIEGLKTGLAVDNGVNELKVLDNDLELLGILLIVQFLLVVEDLDAAVDEVLDLLVVEDEEGEDSSVEVYGVELDLRNRVRVKTGRIDRWRGNTDLGFVFQELVDVQVDDVFDVVRDVLQSHETIP